MIEQGEWIVADKFESLIIRLYNLSASSNGFGISFNVEVVEKFVQKYLYLDSFEVIEILKAIEGKVREDE